MRRIFVILYVDHKNHIVGFEVHGFRWQYFCIDIFFSCFMCLFNKKWFPFTFLYVNKNWMNSKYRRRKKNSKCRKRTKKKPDSRIKHVKIGNVKTKINFVENVQKFIKIPHSSTKYGFWFRRNSSFPMEHRKLKWSGFESRFPIERSEAIEKHLTPPYKYKICSVQLNRTNLQTFRFSLCFLLRLCKWNSC